MRTVFALVLAPLAASTILAAAEAPDYFRVSVLSTQGDLRAYAGGKAFGHGFEIGHTLPLPGSDVIGMAVFAGFMKVNGDASSRFGGLKQSLQAWRFGADFRFATPLPALTPYVGFNVNFFDGKRLNAGSVNTYDGTYALDPGPYAEGKAKLGFRLGLEYRFNERWGASVDYNHSEWYNDFAKGDHIPMSGERPITGLNPINPSWLAFSVQYRFNGL